MVINCTTSESESSAVKIYVTGAVRWQFPQLWRTMLASDPRSNSEYPYAAIADDLCNDNHHLDADFAANTSGGRNLSTMHQLCYLRYHTLLSSSLPRKTCVPSGIQMYP